MEEDKEEAAVRRSRPLAHGQVFSKFIPLDEIPADSRNSLGEYSFYIKAVYEDARGLTPTYHSLVYKDNVTGIDEVVADLGWNVRVSAKNGNIVVEGSQLPAEVFTPAGALAYAGDERTIGVTPGLYIVRVGLTTTKVLVK